MLEGQVTAAAEDSATVLVRFAGLSRTTVRRHLARADPAGTHLGSHSARSVGGRYRHRAPRRQRQLPGGRVGARSVAPARSGAGRCAADHPRGLAVRARPGRRGQHVAGRRGGPRGAPRAARPGWPASLPTATRACSAIPSAAYGFLGFRLQDAQGPSPSAPRRPRAPPRAGDGHRPRNARRGDFRRRARPRLPARCLSCSGSTRGDRTLPYDSTCRGARCSIRSAGLRRTPIGARRRAALFCIRHSRSGHQPRSARPGPGAAAVVARARRGRDGDLGGLPGVQPAARVGRVRQLHRHLARRAEPARAGRPVDPRLGGRS